MYQAVFRFFDSQSAKFQSIWIWEAKQNRIMEKHAPNTNVHLDLVLDFVMDKNKFNYFHT